jgi:hypothetical protein
MSEHQFYHILCNYFGFTKSIYILISQSTYQLTTVISNTSPKNKFNFKVKIYLPLCQLIKYYIKKPYNAAEVQLDVFFYYIFDRIECSASRYDFFTIGGKSCQYTPKKRLGGPPSWFALCGEEKITSP